MAQGQQITPATILRLLLMVMASAFLVILMLSGIGLYYLYSDYVIKRAESDATSISQSFLAIKRDLLLPTQDGVTEPATISVNNQQELDNAIRQFLQPFNIVKVKIFSTDTEIVYSTDVNLIGQFSHKNSGLTQALSGENYSEIKTRQSMQDMGFDERFDVDVVETYVPIYNGSGTIVGSFEIYQDMTRFRSDIVKGVGIAVSVLVVILLAVFVLSIKILNYPVKQLQLVQEKLHKIASMDSLTSIFNRYAILKHLRREAEKVTSGEGTLSIILLDIDHFKVINDTYGHPTGDYVLSKIAGDIQHCIRKGNSVGRYGGEEFLVVLPGIDVEAARDIAEQIRLTVQGTPFEHDNHQLAVTLSAGVSTLPRFNGDIETLIKKTDKALYVAKSSGRNRVITDRSYEERPTRTELELDSSEV